MNQFKRGIYHTLSKQCLEVCSWTFVETRACGKQTIDLDNLRKHTSFSSGLKNKKVDGNKNYEEAFWEVLNEYSEADKKLYLRFVTGRAKLPLDLKAQEYQHTITSMGGNDSTLPQAHTCFNQIDLPPYTTKAAMSRRIQIAFQFCGEVDTDGGRRADY